VLALAVVLSGAARAGEGSPVLTNLLENPGFEHGRQGWSIIETSPHWGDFEVVDTMAHSGSRSVRLPVHQGANDPPKRSKVFGVVQELSPKRFPNRLGGWYRVERWENNDERTDLYLQVVVVVWGDPETARLISPSNPNPQIRNYQLRYYLAGLTRVPFALSNARVTFVEKGPPEQGAWKHFEIPLDIGFRLNWGRVPSGYESLRVLFEARWDNASAGSEVHADVYYDDLFFGYAPEAER